MGCMQSFLSCLGIRKKAPTTPTLPTTSQPKSMDWRSPLQELDYDEYFRKSVLGQPLTSTRPRPPSPPRSPRRPGSRDSSKSLSVHVNDNGEYEPKPGTGRWVLAEQARRDAAIIPDPTADDTYDTIRSVSPHYASAADRSSFYSSREGDSIKSSLTDLSRKGTAKEITGVDFVQRGGARGRGMTGDSLRVHEVPEMEEKGKEREMRDSTELGWERAPEMERNSVDDLEVVDLR